MYVICGGFIMKIIILVGSKRRNGNTAALANSFADGAGKNNDVELISVADVHVNGCIGCNSCFSNDKHACFQKDDMPAIYQKLQNADVIVLATPVYFYNMSSQLKCIIDRLHNPIRNTFKVKKLVLLAVAADDKATHVFDSLKVMYTSILSYFKLEDGGIITVSGVKDMGDINNNPGLKEAYVLGTKMTL